MQTKTEIIKIDGIEYEIKRVEAKPIIYIQNNEQRLFCQVNELTYIFGVTDYHCNFYETVIKRRLTEKWEDHLIGIAREKGFISGCTIKTATDMDKMKSGRLQLIGLSKLATNGRKSIVIYDNGRWVAKAIPEVKKHWFKSDTWNVGELLTRDEMSQVKSEPEKQNIDEARQIIGHMTVQLNHESNVCVIVKRDQALIIREILNDYLNK